MNVADDLMIWLAFFIHHDHLEAITETKSLIFIKLIAFCWLAIFTVCVCVGGGGGGGVNSKDLFFLNRFFLKTFFFRDYICIWTNGFWENIHHQWNEEQWWCHSVSNHTNFQSHFIGEYLDEVTLHVQMLLNVEKYLLWHITENC